jgi:predicted aconitase with swiveling domain
MRLAGDNWQVPALLWVDRILTSGEMKHFGAALANFGLVALYHMVGIPPEAVSGKDVIFYATAGMGKKLRGPALVAKDGFSARYDLDRLKGIFSRPEHKLAGESYLGRILVFDAAKGGVATAWMFYEMMARDMMSAALVLNAVNPIMVQGAALVGTTLISGFDCDITSANPPGAALEINPTAERPSIRMSS